MTSFSDIMIACDCPWDCSLTFVFTEMVIISHSNSYDTGMRDLQGKINDVYVLR